MQNDPEPYPRHLDILAERKLISCELANGHTVKFEWGPWALPRTIEDWANGVRLDPYFAIRVYCTENTIPKRLVLADEFRADVDFDLVHAGELWRGIVALLNTRSIVDYDSFDDLIHEITEMICGLGLHEADLCEHLANLPYLMLQLTRQESFD